MLRLKIFSKHFIFVFFLLGIVVSLLDLKAQDISFEKNTIATGIDNNSGLATADLDGDGDLDVIGNSYSGNEIYWWRNEGGVPVSWTKHTIDENFGEPQYVFSADIDGDGLNDVLATGSVNTSKVAWWRNNGDSWSREIIREDFGNAHGIYADDINGDGKVDIIATAAKDSLICWWENDGSYPVNWTEHIVDNNAPVTQSVMSVDIDKDGDKDIVATSDNQVLLFYNNGLNPVGWSRQVIDENLGAAHWIDAADFNNDGNKDIVACGFSEGYLYWYESDGGDPVNWTKRRISGNFPGGLTVIASDLDNDGNTDLVGTSLIMNQVACWINNGGDPVSWSKVHINSFSYPWALTAGDIDKDGFYDILAGSNTIGGIYYFENQLVFDSVEESKKDSPDQFRLYQNYPNPFNPETTIEYEITESSQVKIMIYNTLGEEVSSLVNEYQSAGTYTLKFNAKELPSGSYICRLDYKNKVEAIKMALIK